MFLIDTVSLLKALAGFGPFAQLNRVAWGDGGTQCQRKNRVEKGVALTVFDINPVSDDFLIVILRFEVSPTRW